MMRAMAGDLRYALRSLGKSRGYTATCILVLALGIGANAAIFSIVESVVLRPLPYPDVARLVFVWERYPNMPDPPGGRIQAAHANYVEWQRQSASFEAMAAFVGQSLNETGTGQPRSVAVQFASAAMFPLLGAKARLGRVFTGDEERKGSDGVMLLSDKWFAERFHRDAKALGSKLTLGAGVYTVIGVMPREFHLPATWQGQDQAKPDVWVPLSRLWNTASDEERRQLEVMARLKPGVSIESARQEMSGIAARLATAKPDLDKGWNINIYPFTVEDTSPDLHQALWVLLGAVGFLLLIACANLANLTLVRATVRTRECAVRMALGASRGRLLGQFLMESLLVAGAGAALGMLVAQWCVKAILALEPPEIQRPELITINLPVFAFAAAAAVITALVFGLAPALGASDVDPQSALKAGGWGLSSARSRSRQILIAIEVSLALVLLTGAGLMLRSLHALTSTGIGFETAQLVTADIDLPQERYRDDASRVRFFHTLWQRAKTLPGVRSAAIVDNLPLHKISVSNFYIAGRPEPPLNEQPMADHASASPDYFDVLGVRLAAGRMFNDADRAANESDAAEGVTIVNQALAKQFFPGANPVGERLLRQDRKRSFRIIGVVTDYRAMDAENGARPQIFWPSLQLTSGTLVLRMAPGAPVPAAGIRSLVYSIDRELAIDRVKTVEQYTDEWRSQRKFNTLLLAIFAGLAVGLALLGIYGVLSNLVASRVREIGIRMAVGAEPGSIVRMVLRQSLVPVAAGLVVGVGASFGLGRFLEALLYGVHAGDPLTLGAAASGILMLSPLAVLVPARRAARVDCVVALREE